MKLLKEQMFRHELKYEVNDVEIPVIINQINHLLSLDRHADASGAYCVRSLYFDDYENRCLRENESGTDPREKFRIRIYNGSAEKIRLECKRKERGKTLKTSCPLTEEQTRLLMVGLPVPDIASQHPVLRKLTLLMLTRRMHPVVIVEYDRLPYTYKNGNVRITLDTTIRASKEVERFLEEAIPFRPVMAIGQQILEVKYDEYLPDFVYQALQLHDLRRTAFSKYYVCRKHMQ